MTFFLIFINSFAFSQSKEIDSLNKALVYAKEDIGKVNLLNELSYSLYMSAEYKASLKYGEEALALAKKIRYSKGEGFALVNIGCFYADQFNLKKSEEYINAALIIAQKTGDKKLLGFCYHGFGGLNWYKNNLAEAFNKYDTALNYYRQAGDKKLVALIHRIFGMMYYQQSNYPEAIRYNYMALKYFEEIGDKARIGDCYAYNGDVYCEYGNYTDALKNYFLALNIYERLRSKPKAAAEIKILIASTLSSIGEVYILQKDPGNALEKYSSASKIYEENISEFQYALYKPTCYIGIARAYELRGDSAKVAENLKLALLNYSRADYYYLESLKMCEEKVVDDLVAQISLYLGNLGLKFNRFLQAERWLQKALLLSKKNQSKKLLRDSYLRLSELKDIIGNKKEGYNYYKMYIIYRDSIVNEESIRKAEGYKIQNAFDKKEDQIKLLSTENKLKAALTIKQRQQKEFAYAGIAAILLAGGYGFYLYRRRKKLQSQQALMSERLRISSELHDEVGATLSGIAMYSHLTKEQMKTGQTAEIEKSLNVMQQSSSQMVDKLSDIVWLINPEQDSLQKLVTRLEEYATDMAAIKNIQVKISVPEKIAEINLPVESRRNIYLFCKEAINNAVKYSNATLLELTVKEVNGKLEFSVSDNGKGFDAVMVRRGNGLENMQKRADEIGAKLILQSKENEGASVSLQFKIT